MAAASLMLPNHGLNQEHRCKKHKSPRYYRLERKHLAMLVKGVKNALASGLQYKFYGAFVCASFLFLEGAVFSLYNGLD